MKILLTLVLAVLASSARAAQPRRFMIGFAPRTSAAQRQAALGRLGADSVESFDELALEVAEVADAAAMNALSDQELGQLGISLIEEDEERNWLLAEPSFQATPLPTWSQVRAAVPPFTRAAAPVNALPPGVEAAEVPWGILRVNAPAAWSVTQGEGARVAVVDTGVDASHPDLAGRVAGGFNAAESGRPWTDDNGHGTHVAGTIAANRDGRGVVGVAPKATLYAVKVLKANGSGRVSNIVKGLVWCARHDIQVANLSLGSPVGSVFLKLAVKYAASKGVAVIAAAGNSGGAVGYPAAYDEAVAVSASDESDRLASFSSRGSKVEFVAPGVGVNSTKPGGGYAAHSGTSMATPHVAGLAALAVSRGARGVAGVRAALARAARGVGLQPQEQGRGMIDAAVLSR